MATLRDIKQRIVGVKSTQQITKAMKMVAAARLRRAQENIISAKPYTRKMAEVLSHLLKSVGSICPSMNFTVTTAIQILNIWS